MTPEQFIALIQPITARIAGKRLDKALEAELDAAFPPEGPVVQAVVAACREGTQAGWLCNREAGGIKFGRVAKPGAELNGFSIDVVDMNDIAGPHHRHPNGEVDLIMPLTPNARFDGKGAGWLVYSPDSAHSPTVSEGRAFVLYLLPEGAIEFTRQPA